MAGKTRLERKQIKAAQYLGKDKKQVPSSRWSKVVGGICLMKAVFEHPKAFYGRDDRESLGSSNVVYCAYGTSL